MREWGINNTTVEVNGKPNWNPQLVAHVIKWIHRKKPPGAILCFVSGWQDIMDVRKEFYLYKFYLIMILFTTKCTMATHR